jgi:hypothetical protein
MTYFWMHLQNRSNVLQLQSWIWIRTHLKTTSHYIVWFACLPFDSPDQIQWTLDGSDQTGSPSVPQLFACLFACSLALCLLVHRQSRSNPVDLRWFTSNPVILYSSALCLLACPWTVQIKSSWPWMV